MSEWTQERITEFRKNIESASFGLTVEEQLSALTEIERQAESIATLTALVRDMSDLLIEISGSRKSSIGSICNTYEPQLNVSKVDALITRAKEALK